MTLDPTVQGAIVGALAASISPLISGPLAHRRERRAQARAELGTLLMEAMRYVTLLERNLGKVTSFVGRRENKEYRDRVKALWPLPEAITPLICLHAPEPLRRAWSDVLDAESALWWELEENHPEILDPNSFEELSTDTPVVASLYRCISDFQTASREALGTSRRHPFRRRLSL